MPLALFDLDNTLLDRATSFLRWATRFAAEHALGPADVAWLVDADGDGSVPRPLFLAAIREQFAVDLPMTAYQAEIVELVELDPAVPLALDGLRAVGWRVAIVTNGQTRQQSAKIRHTGLDLSWLSLVRTLGEGVEDRLGLGGDAWLGCEALVADHDGRGA